MGRVLPVLLPLFFVTACDGGAFLPAGPPGPPGLNAQLRASFPRGGVADTIAVEAVDRLALRAADLVAPSGTVVAAGTIDVAASPRFATGQSVAGDPWRGALLGGGSAAVLAMPDGYAGAALYSQQQLLATVSIAEIALPDPVAYRRDWARYRLRLTFGTAPGEIETREIAAPEPPPQASPQGRP